MNPIGAKMQRINLHTHSIHSDGHNSIIVLAQECKRLRHCALVVTDHVYSKQPPPAPSDTWCCMRHQDYVRARQEAKATYEMSGYPVIIGMELSIKGFEEVCVI